MVERTRKNKQHTVSLLGGKCIRCGYSKCLRALEFHHLDPKNKIKDLNGFRSFSFSRLLEESKKCILLCANCHREEEERIFNQVSVREWRNAYVAVLETAAFGIESSNLSSRTNFMRPRRETGYPNGVLNRKQESSNLSGASIFEDTSFNGLGCLITNQAIRVRVPMSPPIFAPVV